MEVDEQVTPEVDVDVQDDGASGNSDDAAASGEQPFLKVNDRTVYKTQADAVRAYDEAGKRIAQLSSWEKEAKQWGLSDPKELNAVAKELLELRKERAEAAKKAEIKPVTTPAGDPKKEAEKKQVREYLKDLGYISKEDQEAALKELRDKLEALQTNGSQADSVRLQNQVEEGQQTIKGWLSEAKIQDEDGSKQAQVENFIKRYVNGDEEAVETWNRGGVGAKALLKESYDLAIKSLGFQPTQAGNTDAQYAANKAKAVATNKKLPAPGTAKGASTVQPKKPTGINTKVHEAAWKIFQES